MTLKDKLTQDMKQALRDQDSLKLNTIRFLLSEIKNKEIDEGELDDAGVQKVTAKLVKSMKEAIEDFKKGGRQDLVSEEEKKVSLLESYLPAQLSDDQLRAIVSQVVAENKEAQMGQLIGMVMKRAAGQADGGRVAAIVKEVLS